MSGQENQQGVTPQMGYGHSVDDEIDLRELANILIDGWYWLVGSVLLATVLGLYIALSGDRVYETTFNAIPADGANYQALNELPGLALGTGSVFREFGNRLNSFQNYATLVEQYPDLYQGDEETSLLEHFTSKFSIELSVSNEPNGVSSLSVTYAYPDGVNGPELVNRYIALTAEAIWKDYLQRFEVRTNSAMARYSNDIDIQKQGLKAFREERLFELTQASTIAQDLGIETPTTPQDYGRQPAGSEVIYANINADGRLPLYFMGSRALEAEKKVIEESFDTGLLNQAIRALQQELLRREIVRTLLSEGELDNYVGMSHIPYTERLVTVLDYALEPQRPVGRSRALTMIVSVFAGGMFGLVLTFLVKFAGSVLSYRREKAKS
ncbi:hypothetical protein NFC81_06475 [Salinispirillum sp. LH 10-3-1]|uniref:LPS O-antigen length regulator n=1 Tax=Salinispirillum sp. LH 10-3-1 TaxID=2952525 RepID=A0AB38YJ36_9GAMM